MHLRLLLAAAAAFFVHSTALAQGCNDPANNWWQVDNLPLTPPSTAIATSLIPGMCEGEGGGVVFALGAGQGPQRLTKIVAPWGEQNGQSGFQAVLDVEIYDGVSFNGQYVDMGTRVFSLSQDAAQSMQVTSFALNELDVSAYNIIVGSVAPASGTTRRFAVCITVDINLHPTGSCAGGWPANMFTDNSSFTFTCNTPQQRSLIKVSNPPPGATSAWQDAALAQVDDAVFGITTLCPLFYNGTWAIRACSEDAFGASYDVIGAGCPGAAGQSQLINASLPRLGQTMIVNVTNVPYQLGLMLNGTSNTVSDGVPLPFDLGLAGFPAGCTLFTSVEDTAVLFAPLPITPAAWAITIPNQPTLAGVTLHQQAFLFDDPTFDLFQGKLSDAATWVIGY